MSKMPDMLADNATKDSPLYGMQYGKYIEEQWFNGLYESNKTKIKKMRSHMLGEVDASHLKPLFQNHGDLSTLSINWKYQSPMSKFVNSVVEGFQYDMYRSSVQAVDMYSQSQRTTFKREKKKAMYGAEATKLIQQQFGYDFSPSGFVPKSSDELNLYMQLEYKPASEIAMEIGIQKVYDANDWREIFNKTAEDIVLNRVGVFGIRWDYSRGVTFRYVDPEYFIYGRDTERTRDKRGLYYGAEISHMTLAEVERESRGSLSTKQIEALSSKCSRRYTTWEMFTSDELEHTVEVIHFMFKASRYTMMKKKSDKFGRTKYVSKDDYWHPNEYGKDSEVRIPYEVWYEGTYVLGTDICFNYKLVDNIMRDPSNDRKALPPYVMYELSSESMASKIVDIADDLYVVNTKLKQLIMKLKPKGYAIDIDALNSLDLGDGTKMSIPDLIRAYNIDGTLLYSGADLVDQGLTARPPIHDLPEGSGQELQQLVNMRNVLVQDLHDATGISPQATGAAPPSRTSAATYQNTLNTSQRVVNNVFNALLSLQQRSSEVIIARLQSAAEDKETRPIVEAILGEFTTDQLREFANLHKYQFVINVDIKPSIEDRQRLREDLAIALETKSIELADKIDIEMIDNVKLALQMIKLRQKDKMNREAQMAQVEHKRNMEAIQAKAQSDLQRVQSEKMAEAEAKLAVLQGEGQLEAFKAQARMQEISLTKQWDLRIAQETAGVKFNNEKYKEDRKDERLDKQSTHQSKLIEQRTNKEPATSFEQEQQAMPTIPQAPVTPQITQ